MSLASQIAAAHALAQATFEAAYPATITIAAHDFAAAASPWRNSLTYGLAGPLEKRQRIVHISRAALTASSVTIEPGITPCVLDGDACLITDLAGGALDPAFRITCEVISPAAAQP